jgi:hypothetical protein
MSDPQWKVVIEVPGDVQAEILRNLLEADGIKVFLNQEGAGRAVGLTMGPMGEVQIMVPDNQFDQAHQLIDDYYGGKFEIDEGDEPAESESSNSQG